MSDSYVNIPTFDGRPREAGELWTSRKDGRLATCHLWTHPIGGEVGVTVNGELMRSEASRDGLALVERALEWRQQFQEKGSL